jgi:hypothetical protein
VPKSTNSRLPRGPHAERPRPDEVVRKRSGADLQNGWLARHGTLFLTDDRLVFVPTLLDTALRAKRREIVLDDVTEIERYPKNPADLPVAGRRSRMLLHTEPCVYQLIVGDLDAWVDALEIVYDNRVQHGRPHKPKITREGYTNLLKLGRPE